jgi:hypothetical protein
MNRRSISDDFPKHFQRQALSLVSRVVPLTSCGFYLVGDEVTNRWVVFRNLNEDLEQVYRDKFLAHDPLNPALFDGTDTRVACIDEQLPEAELLDSLYYREFMAPLKHRHVADMFFRYGTIPSTCPGATASGTPYSSCISFRTANWKWWN